MYLFCDIDGGAHLFPVVVGVTLRRAFDDKERTGQARPLLFVVLDELNKYAPRDGSSPIKEILLDVAERGRSLGIILVGAQQTASEVERRSSPTPRSPLQLASILETLRVDPKEESGMPLPWQAFAEPDPERDYLVLATYLPLKKLRSTPQFLRFVKAIRAQLARADGLVGYTLKAQPLRRDYFTLSVWEDERALLRFVQATPHVDVMAGLQGHMGKARFRRWSTKGSDVPPDWSAAHRRLETG